MIMNKITQMHIIQTSITIGAFIWGMIIGYVMRDEKRG